jgi:hypothetical protein
MTCTIGPSDWTTLILECLQVRPPRNSPLGVVTAPPDPRVSCLETLTLPSTPAAGKTEAADFRASVVADWQHQTTGETRGRSTAQGEREMMHDMLGLSGLPLPGCQYIRRSVKMRRPQRTAPPGEGP